MNGGHFFSLEQPLHALPAHSQVSAANLHHFPALVDRLGGDSRDVLERYGIDPQVLQHENRFVDCQVFVDMFEYCATHFGDPLFGLHLAEMQSVDIYGCVATLSKSAETIRQGLYDLIEYLPVVHSTESVLELVEGVSVSELRWTEHSDLGANDQADSQGLLLNLKVLRSMAGADFVPSYVNVSDSLYRKAGGDLDRAVGCPVRVCRERSCIAFPSELLDRPSISATGSLYRLLKSYLASLKSYQSPSLLDKVNNFISEGMRSGEVSIEACAQQLGFSSRVLQMRLREKDLSYSDILDRRRLEYAKSKLCASDMPIPEIADQLGYAERTSFGRAFKRWTGVSPKQFRLEKCRQER